MLLQSGPQHPYRLLQGRMRGKTGRRGKLLLLDLIGQAEQIKMNIQVTDALQQIGRETHSGRDEIDLALLQIKTLPSVPNPRPIVIIAVETPETTLEHRQTPARRLQPHTVVVEQPDMHIVEHHDLVSLQQRHVGIRHNWSGYEHTISTRDR